MTSDVPGQSEDGQNVNSFQVLSEGGAAEKIKKIGREKKGRSTGATEG